MVKLMPLSALVAQVPRGAHMTFGGFGHALTPMAFVREMVRQDKGAIELSGVAECWAADLLAGARKIHRCRFSNFMFEGLGRCHNFARAVEQGDFPVEDYSHLGMVTRLRTGGDGLPFSPILSMKGSDIEHTRSFDGAQKMWEVSDPLTGQRVTVVGPLLPDVAVMHCARADVHGNCQVFGHRSAIDVQTRAARMVLCTVEEVVPADVIRSSPEFTVIPSFLVAGVAHVPFGAHPTGMYRYYSEDMHHIRIYYEASRSEAAFQAYLDSWVFGLEDHWRYLDSVGIAHLLGLRTDPSLGYTI